MTPRCRSGINWRSRLVKWLARTGPTSWPEFSATDLASPWIRYAVASSLAEGAGDVFLALAGDSGIRNDSAGYQFLRELAMMIGAKGRLDEVRQVTGCLIKAPLDRVHVFGLLAALGEGLRNTRSSLAMASPQAGLERFFSAAMETAIDSFSPRRSGLKPCA